MKITQIRGNSSQELNQQLVNHNLTNGFALYFASAEIMKSLKNESAFSSLKYPVIGCSTSGEISDEGLSDDTVIMTLCEFEKSTQMKSAVAPYAGGGNERQCGLNLGEQLPKDAKLVVVLGIGVDINGSELVRGIQEKIGNQIPITGGLAGDAAQFVETFVGLNENIAHNQVVALAFSGDDLQIGYGSRGGWKPFGPDRRVTKSKGNVLFELDGESALGIYKTYLEDKAKDLPASGLLYPFAINDPEGKGELIRTILGIDEAAGSLTLAGEITEGAMVKLMHTGTEGLIEGAEEAARLAGAGAKGSSALAVLVSCVGRKLVMGEDTDDEIDAVRDELGKNVTLTGFYSHGEICPFDSTQPSKLHNQTMTVTYISEK